MLVGGDEEEVGGRGHGKSLSREAVGVEGGVGDFEVEADALADEGLEVLAVPGDFDVDAVGDLGVAVGVGVAEDGVGVVAGDGHGDGAVGGADVEEEAGAADLDPLGGEFAAVRSGAKAGEAVAGARATPIDPRGTRGWRWAMGRPLYQRSISSPRMDGGFMPKATQVLSQASEGPTSK